MFCVDKNVIDNINCNATHGITELVPFSEKTLTRVLGNSGKNCHHQDPAVTAEQTEDIFKSQSEPNALKILDILRGQTAHKAVDDVRKK